jgi:hypothetical protein
MISRLSKDLPNDERHPVLDLFDSDMEDVLHDAHSPMVRSSSGKTFRRRSKTVGNRSYEGPHSADSEYAVIVRENLILQRKIRNQNRILAKLGEFHSELSSEMSAVKDEIFTGVKKMDEYVRIQTQQLEEKNTRLVARVKILEDLAAEETKNTPDEFVISVPQILSRGFNMVYFLALSAAVSQTFNLRSRFGHRATKIAFIAGIYACFINK